MAETKISSDGVRFLSLQDLIMPAAIVTVLLFMIFPLPAVTLDVGLALNIAFSFLILLITLFVTEPLQFSAFPSLLLVTTLMRLSFNVAATRLILTHGNEGTHAAGHLIEAFGGFVGGNDAIVGFIVFVILVIIQFVVITNGAQRVSEVSALSP
jgi:flagellar biosynthesis protein FlhA